MGGQKPRYDLVPIQRLDVHQAVLERIQDLIREGGLRPGDQLPSEREMAEKLGVSRVSVRQALKVLESMGRVVSVTGSGTYVKDNNNDLIVRQFLADFRLDLEFLRHLVAVRACIDAAAFEAAFERWDPAHMTRVRSVLDRHEAEIQAAGQDSPANFSLEFEALFGAFSGNPLLARLQSIIHQLWLHAWSRQGLAPGRRRQLHQEHVAIAEAIAQADWPRARELLRLHVDRNVGPAPGAADAPEEEG